MVGSHNLSFKITGTDPLKDNLKLREVVSAEPNNPKADFTAKLANTLSEAIYAVLTKHPINLERQKEGKDTANIVLLRGCGQRLNV